MICESSETKGLTLGIDGNSGSAWRCAVETQASLLSSFSVFLTLGCGDSDSPAPAAPTPTPTPTPTAPDVSGRYTATNLWTLQVLRNSDNFQTSFNCGGTMTLTQSPGSFAIGGFMASTGPCEPVAGGTAGAAPALLVTSAHSRCL